MTTDNEQQARELLKRLVEVLNAKPGEQTSSVNAVMLLAQSFIERTEPEHPATTAWRQWTAQDPLSANHKKACFLAGAKWGMEAAAEMVVASHSANALKQRILDAAGKVPKD